MAKTIKNKLKIGASFSAEAGIGLPYSRASVSKIGARYMPFSNDSARYQADNLYPQQLATLAFNAPTHNSALKTKQFMIEGEGFNLELLEPALLELFENINDKGETANDVLNQISWDYSIFGGFALRVRWNANSEISEVFHVPFTDVRVGIPDEDGDINYFVVSNNWDKTLTASQEKSYVINKFNPDWFSEGVDTDENGIPAPTEDQIDNAEQLIYFWNYKPYATNGMRYYPLPDYVGALDQIMTEYSIGVANKSKIDNGVAGKTVITFPYLPQSEAEQAEIDSAFKHNFTGADKDGTVIITYANSKDDLPQIENLPSLDSDTYIELEKSTKQNIITAHRVPAILVEYNYGGGFNNRAEEMSVAFSQYQRTSIKSYQNSIVRVFKSLTKHMGYDDAQIEIIPFSLTDDNTPTQGGTSLENA